MQLTTIVLSALAAVSVSAQPLADNIIPNGAALPNVGSLPLISSMIPVPVPSSAPMQPATGMEGTTQNVKKARYFADKRGVEVAADLKLGVNIVGDKLDTEVKTVIKKIEALVQGYGSSDKSMKGVSTEIESALKTLTSTLEQTGVDALHTVLNDVSSVTSGAASKKTLTNEAAVNPLSSVYSGIANLFSILQSIEGDIPGLGSVLQSAQTEIQGALSEIVGTLGKIATPLVAELNGLLSPVESLLNDLGLSAVTDLLNSIL